MRKPWGEYIRQQNEDRVTVSGILGVTIYDFNQNDKYAKIDWYTKDEDGKVTALIEHRRRYQPSTAYNKTFISEKKLNFMLEESERLGIKAYFLTVFDELICCIDVSKVKDVAERKIMSRGKAHRHNPSNDDEMGYYINLEDCVIVDGKTNIFCD